VSRPADAAIRRLSDYREWKKAVEVDADALGAILRRALVVDCDIYADPDGGISTVCFELHHEGEPNRFVRLAAHGMHTEGWIYGEVKP
jgi:hypothetical protein